MSRDLVVSVDAMGGDYAPDVEIDGIDRSLIRHPGARFLLHGDEARLAPLLEARPRLKDACEIRHTAERVSMDDKPSQILRRGQNTSMWKAIEGVKTGEASVAISSGNTGALMAMAKLQLKTMSEIGRPAIAAIWPTVRGESIVLDVGANVRCTPKELVDFALMGEAFARAALGVPRPTVGLLNIGSEALKGTDEVRAADELLRDANLPIDYRGFVEGDNIGAGSTDVVVTDGFTGNVALKTAEGTARQIAEYLRSSITRSMFAQIGYVLASGAFKTLRTKMDPRRVNGGVFLGLNGVVVKSHGGTDGTGFASALDLAVDMGRSDFASEISRSTGALSAYLTTVSNGSPDEVHAS